ncbi:hypothetical protein [Oceanobacillus massiliensis]|uniref:hypothetical protein n=1 Tax=Oceanobacillus massiliensis TaxID=1465765 RepID=UPI000678345C|nr:hypothetical protein [Oceanobacillus massiliensis]
MNKVGIITLNGYKNYGNRLQNYALQEAIKAIGFNVETIVVDPKAISSNDKKSLSFFDINLIKKVTRKLINIKNKNIMRKGRINLKSFLRNIFMKRSIKFQRKTYMQRIYQNSRHLLLEVTKFGIHSI